MFNWLRHHTVSYANEVQYCRQFFFSCTRTPPPFHHSPLSLSLCVCRCLSRSLIVFFTLSLTTQLLFKPLCLTSVVILGRNIPLATSINRRRWGSVLHRPTSVRQKRKYNMADYTYVFVYIYVCMFVCVYVWHFVGSTLATLVLKTQNADRPRCLDHAELSTAPRPS